MHLLVLRFSALGDVALTLPALQSVLQQNPEVNITVVTREAFAPIFSGVPRLTCVGADLRGKHKGLSGALLLAKEVYHLQKFYAVIDLHGLLRSYIVSAYLWFRGVKILRFSKGRWQKRRMLRNGAKQPLPHTTARYLAPFGKLGLKNSLIAGPWRMASQDELVDNFINEHDLEGKTLIGIAPFAQHQSKTWPLLQMVQVIQALSLQRQLHVLLFGGGAIETSQLDSIASENNNSTVVAGRLPLASELNLMAKLSAMISMDSANMHLATLCGIPVVSIWGPTHHFIGFGPLGNEAFIVEVPTSELPCRPCSIFGKLHTDAQRECAKQAMDGITPAMVLNKLHDALRISSTRAAR